MALAQPVVATASATPTTSTTTASTGSAAIAAPLMAALIAQAPTVDPQALGLALQARNCAVASGQARAEANLTLIDYSRPSTEPRLWVFDLTGQRVLYTEHVAHGRNTGHNMATSFSNVEGSYQSSLGLFATAESYVGSNGYSMRMDGLEAGVNDAARARAIVIHGAPYVNPEQAKRQGRLGRSLGCPALRQQVAREVIDTIKDGHLVFAYYPDQEWLASSRFLACPSSQMAAAGTTTRG
ncbi:murein L,D-transpeptidase catalytic domain family protein [Lysobacter sp. A3-1-A15]|uniref:murein L,D-transpeptidase catalytic domain family protein n=1 Tax=Novilysobacter viscosus TaxID=3098602 RepID=UPI0039836EB6